MILDASTWSDNAPATILAVATLISSLSAAIIALRASRKATVTEANANEKAARIEGKIDMVKTQTDGMNDKMTILAGVAGEKRGIEQQQVRQDATDVVKDAKAERLLDATAAASKAEGKAEATKE